MKLHSLVSAVAGLFAFAGVAHSQTMPVIGQAPLSFGDTLFTDLPSEATSSTGVTSVFGSNGATMTFGTGGALVNPAAFTYTVTGPNTATLSVPATATMPATTTELTFISPTSGVYTRVGGGASTTGSFRLTELPSSAALANVSVRTTLSSNETATVGFVVGGAMPRRVLIRAIGPGMSAFGVSAGLGNPALTVFRGSQAIAMNDDWGTAAPANTGAGSSGGAGNGITITPSLATSEVFTQVGAFGLTAGSRDAALSVMLSPGAYTVQVMNSTAAGGNGTAAAGDVLVEVYFVE